MEFLTLFGCVSIVALSALVVVYGEEVERRHRVIDLIPTDSSDRKVVYHQIKKILSHKGDTGPQGWQVEDYGVRMQGVVNQLDKVMTDDEKIDSRKELDLEGLRTWTAYFSQHKDTLRSPRKQADSDEVPEVPGSETFNVKQQSKDKVLKKTDAGREASDNSEEDEDDE